MKKTNKKEKIIVIAIVGIILLAAIIVAVVQVTNNNNVENSEYEATITGAGSSLIASYIKAGVRIGGITGTLEVLDTSDANATAEDILQGKTAYVDGEKITGTYVPSNNYTFTDSYGNEVKVPRRIWSSKPRR